MFKIFKKEKFLYRKYLIEYNDKLNLAKLNKNSLIEFINNLEKDILSFSYKNDDRYVLIGRYKMLMEEMVELNYSKEEFESSSYDIVPVIWCLYNIVEMITQPNYLTLQDYANLANENLIYKNKDTYECREIYDTYVNEGIICKDEIEIVVKALDNIKRSLERYNDNLHLIN